MRITFWLISLFGAASALALFASTNDGTVSIFYPPYRIDMSLNLVLVTLFGLFGLIYLAARAVLALLALPERARDWRAVRHETALRSSLMNGLIQLQAGRFTRARRSALAALTSEANLSAIRPGDTQSAHMRLLAHLLAAHSAHALRDDTERDAHVQGALALAQKLRIDDGQEAVLLRAANWALSARDLPAARGWLDQLSSGASRRTAALRLRLKLDRESSRSIQALETARLLSKHKAFTSLQAQSLIQALVLESIDACHDKDALLQIWAELNEAETAMPQIPCRAASRWLALGGDGEKALSWLAPLWLRWSGNPATLEDPHKAQLAQAIDAALSHAQALADWLSQLEGAHKRWPADPRIAYLTAMACFYSTLWGKAQQMLERSLPRLTDTALKVRGWQALAELAQKQGDAERATQALQTAFGLGVADRWQAVAADKPGP